MVRGLPLALTAPAPAMVSAPTEVAGAFALGYLLAWLVQEQRLHSQRSKHLPREVENLKREIRHLQRDRRRLPLTRRE